MLANHHPPGLPAIVALYQRSLRTSDPWVVGEALRRFYCGCCIAIALISYLLARQFFGMGWALAVALIASLNLYTWWLGDYLLAEVPFTVVSLLFILVSIVAERKRVNTAAITMIQAVLVTAAYLLRTAGVALIAAWIGDAALRRQWRATIVRAIVGATPVLVWHTYVHHVEDSYEYPASGLRLPAGRLPVPQRQLCEKSRLAGLGCSREGQGHASLRREAVCKESDRDPGNVR